ncbi:MAG: ATP-grasp domain-containing protein [Magnetococcales bacterium]|nr:ATP-grasp domain-containing protein [Magnetococcales bacterium]MBF0150259.1 ATP-grasp domain-containing protein [Magnetococcales bacterium]MBF0172159.1 ATP-grasp domain-containing protein [Magnetococcales bacterium]MBF0347959.1 ATP-grasp domain-containing protein [Magnetococcales bacterium]MBF0630541.1 ATP-grasp domain-containing protein [Magnetococcales bacterium]
MNPGRPTSDWRSWTIAITGMNARPDNPGPGMAVARCLREYPGFRGRLVGLGYDALDAGLYDVHSCDDAYLLPYPSMGEGSLLDRLEEIQKQRPLDAIIPCLDSELTNFQCLLPALQGRGIATWLPSRQSLAARGKDRLPALCDRVGVDTPATRTVNDPQFFDSCQESGWSYPLVIKGLYYDAQIVHSSAEAKAVSYRIARQWGYPILAQQFIPGHEINLTAVCDQRGRLLGAVMMRKRAITDKGKAWAGITIEDDALLAMAQTLSTHLTWRGPLEVEALRGEDGKLYLVEINPRFPSWIYLSHAVERNLPALLLSLMAEETIPELPTARTGTLFIRHAREVIVTLEQLAAISTTGTHPQNGLK